MKDTIKKPSGYFYADECSLDEFVGVVSQSLDKAELSFAAAVEQNIPIYDINALGEKLSQPDTRLHIMSEWADVLRNSAGVLVLKGAYADTAPIDAASEIYNGIIETQRKESDGEGDHFAKAGANDRIWNSLQKLCDRSPETFARYFGNVAIAAVCEAWLGPNYQMTAQVNLVRPGGAAQQAHRDYHLGFQTAEASSQYPAHVHDLSPALTLQGAVAHTDMPVETGPTKLLPFSQLYRAGYAAWRREDFRNYFEAHQVQLPLSKGDAVFFSPALFHAAGDNFSKNTGRMANLLQVSSAFGRAMETIDRKAMSEQLFPAMAKLQSEGALTKGEIVAAVASCAEGYSFPTNLDRDPPLGGLAPETQQAIFHRALAEKWTPETFSKTLQKQVERRKA
ncbi:phytanoyl-CoA dioxygenase [Rhodobacterales bacterium 52_120_T64]|nr:phytanoyl-CoA dioxygenase [Rhodobacterales bacterium 52_120_T64]